MLDAPTLEILAGTAIGAGIFGGVLAGLLGVGGGIVIVPALYFALSFAGMDPGITMQVAVATSLMTIIFTSISSSLAHYRRGALDLDLLKLWAPSILVGVVAGSYLGGILNGKVLIAVFAAVAGLVALDMMIRRPSKTPAHREFSKPVWAGLGVAAGAVSAMMGIGGGTVCVPILSFLGYDIRRAVGTASAIGFIIGLPATIVYVVVGWNVPDLPPYSIGYVNLLAAAVITPLTMVFAPVGVRIAHSISEKALKLVFGIFLGITSLRMIVDLLTSQG